MKSLLVTCIFLLTSYSYAQDSTQIEKAETPRIISKLNYGETLKFNDIELRFVKVISDSRCPKNVTCVWAGEAVVLVDVYKKGKFFEQKKLSFSPTSYLKAELTGLFVSKKLRISGLNILPYPEYRSKIKTEDYYIQLVIED